VLIVRLDAIGDALTTVPLIAALRARGIRTGVVLRSVNAEIFSRSAVDRVHVAEQTDARDLHDAAYDYALIPSEEPAAYSIARKAGIPVRIGFDNGLRGKPFKTLWIRAMCTRTIYRNASLDPRGLHECEIVFELAQPLLGSMRPSRDPQVLRPMVIDRAVPADARICMQITDKWERLGASIESVVRAAKLASDIFPVRLIGAAFESDYCAQFERASNQRVELFDSVPRWKEAIAAARGLIAPDSGAMHVAGMTGTPVAACFAPREFALQTARWAPWAAPHALFNSAQDDWPERAVAALAPILRARTPA
jgi:ADP-heptose:LPS heptosyltransferase